MITSSGPGDLFVVRNVGNLVPLPGEEGERGDESVAAAIQYAVEVLRVESVTVCGHSGCGAIQALHTAGTADGRPDEGSPLSRWLRHGRPSMERAAAGPRGRGAPRLGGRVAADDIEVLSLNNVLQQLEHLRAHECVARRLREGSIELHGMYFDVGRAQAYVLAESGANGENFAPVHPEHRETA
jgi:carbonic anhydrase